MLDELVHEGHEGEVFAGGLGEAGGDVHEDVETGEVTGAEGRGLGASDERAGERVHRGDREVVFHHQAAGDDHPVHAEPVGDEAGHVLGEDDALAEDAFLEVADGLQHLVVRLGRGDQLEEVHIPRRIEIVRAEEAFAEAWAAALEQVRHRDPRGVRGHDGVGGDLFELGEEFLLGRGLLDDRFADPRAVAEQREMVGGVADGDAARGRGVEEGRRLGLADAVEAVASGLRAIGMCGVVVARDVEQDDGESGGGREGGDPGSHRAGANDADSGDPHCCSDEEWSAVCDGGTSRRPSQGSGRCVESSGRDWLASGTRPTLGG